MDARKVRLGKKLKVGDTFLATTKRMTKTRKTASGRRKTYEVLRSGNERKFIKGKRSYICKVIGLVENRTGLHHYKHYGNDIFEPWQFTRWWQFTYLVKIIQN